MLSSFKLSEEKAEKDAHILQELGIPGAKYLERQNLVDRCIWITVLVVFVALTYYQLSSQVRQYLAGDIATNVEATYPAEFKFPAVAICNNNQFRLSYVASEQVRERVPIDSRPINRSAMLMEQVLDTMWDHPADDFLWRAYQSLEGMLVSCKLDRLNCADPKHWSRMMTLDGYCWVFNFNQSDAIFVNQTGHLWCESFRRQILGADHGLELILNAQTYDHFTNWYEITEGAYPPGFKVLIMNQTERPLRMMDGINVIPGATVNVPFQILERKIYEESGTCYPDTDETRRAQADVLSERNIRSCGVRVYMQYFRQYCNCSVDSLFANERSDAPDKCNVDKYFSCIVITFYIARDDIMADIRKKCLPPCEQINHVARQDIAKLPAHLLPVEAHVDSLFPDLLPYPNKFTMQYRTIVKDAEGRLLYETHQDSCGDEYHITKDMASKIKAEFEAIMETRARYEDESIRFMLHFKNFTDKVYDLSESLGFPLAHASNDDYALLLIDSLNLPTHCRTYLEMAKNLNHSSYVNRFFSRIDNIIDFEGLGEFRQLRVILNQYFAMQMSKKQFVDELEQFDLSALFDSTLVHNWKEPLKKALSSMKLENAAQSEVDVLRHMLRAANPSANQTNIQECANSFIQRRDAKLVKLQKYQQAFTKLFKKSVLHPLLLDAQSFKFDHNFEKKNLALLRVYIDSTAIEKWSQYLQYTFWSFTCDVGGGLGLFLGFSVVALFDIIYSISKKRCFFRQRHRHRANEMSELE